MKRKSVVFFLIILSVFMQNCEDAPKEKINNETSSMESKKETKNESDFNTFPLEENGIKIALPNGFKRQSAAEYELFLMANYSKKTLEYEKERLRNLRKSDGQFYLFFNDTNASSLSVNVTDPLSITDDNSQGLLNMVTAMHTEAKKQTQREYEKVTAGFSQKEGISIFKSVYKVTVPKKTNLTYEHSYIITNADLSVSMVLITPEDINLDPFIEKLKL